MSLAGSQDDTYYIVFSRLFKQIKDTHGIAEMVPLYHLKNKFQYKTDMKLKELDSLTTKGKINRLLLTFDCDAKMYLWYHLSIHKSKHVTYIVNGNELSTDNLTNIVVQHSNDHEYKSHSDYDISENEKVYSTFNDTTISSALLKDSSYATSNINTNGKVHEFCINSMLEIPKNRVNILILDISSDRVIDREKRIDELNAKEDITNDEQGELQILLEQKKSELAAIDSLKQTDGVSVIIHPNHWVDFLMHLCLFCNKLEDHTFTAFITRLHQTEEEEEDLA